MPQKICRECKAADRAKPLHMKDPRRERCAAGARCGGRAESSEVNPPLIDWRDKRPDESTCVTLQRVYDMSRIR